MPNQKKDILFLVKFGKHLRALREQRGYTQEKLAAECDLVDVDIRRIESGKLNTGLTRIKILADGLGISPKELFDFE